MSPKAYLIYDYLAKTRKASSVVSQVLVNWDMDHTPTLQFGDVRTMPNGDKCVWSENGWMIQEEGEKISDLESKKPEQVESANERWMREQKELNEK